MTSTPNSHILSLAQKYKPECRVNTGKSGISEDWNFGLQTAKGRLVTIAHQDDIYEPVFAGTVLDEINKRPHPLIAFTDYVEIRNGIRITKNCLLNIKQIMLFPLRIQKLQEVRWVRRMILPFFHRRKNK